MRTTIAILILAGIVLAGGADQAARLLENGQSQKALDAAKRLVEKDPGNLDAWLVLADAQIALGEPGDAWTTMENAIEKHPKEVRFVIKLGDVFLKMAEMVRAGGGDGTTITNYYLDAERTYHDASKLDPKSADALYGRAFANYWLNRKETKELANKLLAECLALDPNHARAHALQADMLYFAKKYPEAQGKYEVALELDDSNPLNMVRYGHCLYSQKKLEEAKNAYIAGLKRHPDSVMMIGSGLYYVGNYGKNPRTWANVRDALTAAVKEAPKSAPAWYYLGYGHFESQDWAKALDCYRRASALVPGDATYLYSIGYAYEKMGKGKKALSWYRKALKASPDHKQATFRFAQMIPVMQTEIEGAEKMYEELLTLAPNTGWAFNNYALIIRNWAEATRKHKQKDPPADVKRRLKRSSEVYERAAELDSENPQVLSDTGLLFEFYPCTYDPVKAKRYFTASLENSEYCYRDAFDGLDRLCRRTKDWETLEEFADAVIGSLERGNHAIAPVGASEPKTLPNETPGLKARAEAALRIARQGLEKAKG